MSETSAVDLEAALAAVSRVEENDLVGLAQGSGRLHFEYLSELYPSLIEYRGGLFIEGGFDQATVDDVIQHSGEANPIVAAQRFVNSMNLAATDDVFDPVLARALGESIAFAWVHWVRDRFGREIVTEVEIEDHSGTVWFRAHI